MTGTNKPVHSRAMSPIHPRAAAIDVGAKMHVAAVGPDRASEPVRTFGTFTDDLHRLADWFQECGIETVAMESTGVYWIPVFEILEQRGFEVLLVNARDAKHVPGRKTDVSDAQWLQRLHEFGLLRASFLPKGEIAALRAYLRQRERLVELAASHIQHIQKALMQMNVQVHHVVSDIMGVTGMRILRAIVAGERDPGVLAANRDRRCRADVETIQRALTGTWRAEHLFALEQALALYDTCQEKVVACDKKIEATLKRIEAQSAKPVGELPPARRTTRQPNAVDFDVRTALHAVLGVDLTQIHGLGPYLALKLVGECGTDLSAWPALHLLAWPGAEQQDLRRKGPVLKNAPYQQPGGVIAAPRGSDGGTYGYGAGRLLPPLVGPCRQGPSPPRPARSRCSSTIPYAMGWTMPIPAPPPTRSATGRGF